MNNASLIQNFIIIASRKIGNTTRNIVDKSVINRTLSITRYLVTGLMLILVSCTGGPKTGLNETPTRGNIKIVADESFQPLIDTEVFTFTHLYENAKIKPIYKPEFDVVNYFMTDSAKVIVTSKKLTDDQVKYLRDTLVIARTTTFAYDALALVTNKENKDTLITYSSIKDIFTGNTRKWKEVDEKSKLGDIRVIFDHTKSGNIRYS